MPCRRYREMMRFLRFDRREERQARLAIDKFALITDVWKDSNSIRCYRPGENVTPVPAGEKHQPRWRHECCTQGAPAFSNTARRAAQHQELNDSKGSGKGLIQNHSESFTARTARTSRRGQAGRRTLR
uniref:Transposase n=1 Tax=Knipowitschia caucasica TaxID=637954 RepID=A0AAV2MHS5_KNICA